MKESINQDKNVHKHDHYAHVEIKMYKSDEQVFSNSQILSWRFAEGII
jgi:hypothetical protein